MTTDPIPTITYSGINQVYPGITFTPGDNTVRLGVADYMTIDQLDQFMDNLQAARHWASTGRPPEPLVHTMAPSDMVDLSYGQAVRDKDGELWFRGHNNTVISSGDWSIGVRDGFQVFKVHTEWGPITRAESEDDTNN